MADGVRQSPHILRNTRISEEDEEEEETEFNQIQCSAGGVVPNGAAALLAGYALPKQDNSSQTDDELLVAWLPFLRKRRVTKTDSNTSSRSSRSMLSGKTDDLAGSGGNLVSSSRPPKSRQTSRSSASSKGSRKNSGSPKNMEQLFFNPAVASNLEAGETDSLLLNEQRTNAFEQSFFNEQAPLLGADMSVHCDTTSEETLTDTDQYRDMGDDLTLYVNSEDDDRRRHSADQHYNNFNSCSKLRKNSDNSDRGRSSQASTVSADRAYRNIPVSSKYESRSSESMHTPVATIRSATSAPSLAGHPDCKPMGTGSSNTLNIPDLHVKGRGGSGNGGATQQQAAMAAAAAAHAQRRFSIISSSSADSDKTSVVLSLEDLSVNGLKLLEDEADSVTRFQEYLRTKGLELDLNAVQSSDV